MRLYRYRLLNVFTVAGNRLSGNPLCVFEDGDDLDGAAMQALARQFNLSETTFIFPSDKATARVRIYTPAFELPFAGLTKAMRSTDPRSSSSTWTGSNASSSPAK